jgi:preprotein translocase subunit SecD
MDRVAATAALVASSVGLSVILVGGGGGGGRAGASEGAPGVLFRPVLCAVPPYDKFVTSAQPALSVASCGPSALTTASVQVTPSKQSPLGYIDRIPQPAIILEGERTTKPAHDAAAKVVLLGGLPGSSLYAATATSKGVRYVLGPAVMTSRAIASATVTKSAGRWIVEWTTTPSGLARWDRVAQENFHRLLALDVGGVVVTAPIIEPTQAGFTSFNGRGQVSGNWTQAEATRIATAMESGG